MSRICVAVQLRAVLVTLWVCVAVFAMRHMRVLEPWVRLSDKVPAAMPICTGAVYV
jgi:hypothetical protein